MSYKTASHFMDKEINSESTATGNNGSNNDFIDFMNRQPEKNDEVVPTYDFMSLGPAVKSSSPPPAAQSLNFDSDDDDAPDRTGNSFASRSDPFQIKNYNGFDTEQTTKFVFGKSGKPANASSDVSLVSEIDKTMKKYADILMHAIDGVSGRLSQLETRTCDLENSMNDLKLTLGNNLGRTDGKIRQLENILREVQTVVKNVRDKQEVIEAELHIANFKLVPKLEQENESRKTPDSDSTQPVASANLLPSLPQHQSSEPQVQPPTQFPENQVPSSPEPETDLPPLKQFPQNEVPSAPEPGTYSPPPGQTSVNPSLQYQIPPPQPLPHAPPVPPEHENQPLPQPHYSQPHQPSQVQPLFPGFNPPLSHPQGEVPYMPTSLPPFFGVPQQFYRPTPNPYKPPYNRPGPLYSGPYGPSSGQGEPFPYSSSKLHYGSGSPVKPPQLTSPTGHNGGSSYSNLPIARILPQALPTASGTGGGSASGGSGNRFPIDDVINKVTSMGFPRDQVKETVHKLTEDGESIDLNVVLDKLMNGSNQ